VWREVPAWFWTRNEKRGPLSIVKDIQKGWVFKHAKESVPIEGEGFGYVYQLHGFFQSVMDINSFTISSNL
jgi:hypothetical protein